MANKKTTLPFVGTAEQEQELKAALRDLKSIPGALMPALQKAQHIYGYLPIEVQRMVAEELSLPLEEVYGVATFYSQFSLNPKGKYKVSVCLGTACYVKGAGEIFEELGKALEIAGGECTADGKFSLEACRCIGACGLAPVLTVNEDVYGRLQPGDIADILKKYQD
ncbi:NAD(P)H-dependent oxidoreductase subunit E [Oscillospiraceae bacterium MB08-C2-2]|nr:NAD(P)H-dependent oxidoreductase subunit E [Oscillospiraceae bacterium MB08-C2-2]